MPALLAGYYVGKPKKAVDTPKVVTPSNNATVKTVADNNATKPVRKLTAEEEKVLGVYTRNNHAGTIYKSVFLDNRMKEFYVNGKKRAGEGKWELVDGELHFEQKDGRGRIGIKRINEDGSLTGIAYVTKDGKRVDKPKQDQLTYKKNKIILSGIRHEKLNTTNCGRGCRCLRKR